MQSSLDYALLSRIGPPSTLSFCFVCSFTPFSATKRSRAFSQIFLKSAIINSLIGHSYAGYNLRGNTLFSPFLLRSCLRRRLREMEKEGKSLKASKAAAETDFVLQWGNRKRLRCLKVKKDQNFNPKPSSDSLGKKKIPASRAVTLGKDSSSLPQRLNKNCGSPMNNRKSSVTSPEKEDRYYTTRGSLGLDENGKVVGLDHHRHGNAGDEEGGFVWPKLFISLSSKEKEEDFMAMKGCKLPQRPKKRAKLLQRSLLLVMPGTWLSDLCQERYEVREKKASKKRPRGLKAMGSMDSDSE